MRVLVVGASGYVGSCLSQALIDAGHTVSCAVRDVEATQHRFPRAKIFHCDFLHDTEVADWLPRLNDIDIVVNCVGVFYPGNKKVAWAIHYETPKALFAAAEKNRIKIIHLSALGIERYQNDYACSKMAAENYLNTLTVPHIILRPSIIYGPGAGGSMMILQALAALPFFILLPGRGEQAFQPIHVADLVKAMKHFIEKDFSQSATLAAVSSQPLSLKAILGDLRQCLGFKTRKFISIPLWMIKLVARMGDFIPQSTINTTAVSMMVQGNWSSEQASKAFQNMSGVVPKPFVEGVHCFPVGEAETWYAKLFYMRPLLRISLAFMWLMSALTSLYYPRQISYKLLHTVGISHFWQPFMLYAAIFFDAVIGFALLMNYKTKLNCIAQIALIFFYTLIISLKLPSFWLDPFGPLVKNIPLFISVWILYSMAADE
jgi:uncharacterized protein YbjT (DUF2867 family)